MALIAKDLVLQGNHGDACREWANFESLKDTATDELLENDWYAGVYI